jgi:acetoacetyl-CoA synthetase
MSGDILWQASAAQREASALWQFAQNTRAQHGAAPDDYASLHAWSIREPEAFWSAVWDELGIIGQRGERSFAPGAGLRGARFFPQARLNYAENLLRHADSGLAMVVLREDGTRRAMTREELSAEVSRFAQALRAEGIGTGDRVAAIVTHDLEALVGYLACASIGALWSSCSPDFGPEAASDRLGQIAPALLLAVPSYRYGGRMHDVTATLRAVAEAAGPKRIVLISDDVPATLHGLPCTTLASWLQPFSPTALDYVQLPFNAPLVILYSSGTTGKPKAIVHSAGGLLLQHLKELRLHCDIRAGERFFYYTTCGWMMWNWQVSALALGATLVSYDGNPFTPGAARLLDLCDAEPLDIFGTSARYLDACARTGLVPRESHQLPALRLILSTGSPLQPETFDYIYRDWKSDLQLASISGGTDICGCFLGGNPLLPVRRGELQCALLGMDMAVFDDNGQPVIGQNGELVCRSPHPSQPLGFWGDLDGSRYHAAYFAGFPGVWTHGDFAEQRDSGGFVIHGRSDTTLNPGGVRIGTAEIYRQLDAIPEILEALAVGEQFDGDERILLFLRLREGVVLDEELQQRIRTRLRQGASPRHVPARILAVPDFPRTRSGKLSESAVRDVVNSRPVRNAGALANPEVLDLFQQRSN